MYLYTDRVYNHKIDDYINSTSIKLKLFHQKRQIHFAPGK